jgi:protein gp37
MIQYEIHPIANYLPEMTDTEFQWLKKDIAGLGVIDPIVLLGGKILDGRHRYRACQELGIECPTREINNASPKDIVASLNLIRRHLNPGQIGMVMTQLAEPYAEEAKLRQEAAGKEYGRGMEKVLPPATKAIDTAKVLAEKGGIGKSTMQDALTVDAHGTEEQKKSVINGKESVKAVARQVREEVKNKPKALAQFNQTNDSIEWARYTWNPVTGCKQGCKYCYARDIAMRYTNAFPNGFEPTFIEDRLSAPVNTKVPPEAPGSNNVFVCSMADLFGDWVPQEWIDKVIDACRNAPDWNFIFLTKNPKRLLSVDWPPNAWVGTTVDCQARVSDAVEVFDEFNRMRHGMAKGDGSGDEYGSGTGPSVKFISCEPLTESIVFPSDGGHSSLELFDWVIIGGQSASSGTPAFQPKWEWVEELHFAAIDAGCAIYWKPNLTVRPKEYPEREQ